MSIKEEINETIDKLGITRAKAAEIMDISYSTLKQKNSDKSERYSWNNTNLKKINIFKKKFEKIF